jgi:hypothetical protein
LTRLTAIVRGLLASGVAADDLDIEVLRDAVWFATVVAAQANRESSPTGSPPDPQPELTTSDVTEKSEASQAATGQAAIDVVKIYPSNFAVAEPPWTARWRVSPVWLDAPAPLPSALALTRALRPFRRTRKLGHHSVFDIEGTVRATVEANGLLQPVMRRLSEPRFSAHLVIDDAASMALWASPLHSFADVLRRANVFISVQEWRLASVDGQPLLEKRGSQHHPQIEAPWLTTSHDNLVLLATDGRDERWRSDAWWEAVWNWGQQSSMALLNPLPSRWWSRTALPPDTVRIHAQPHARSNIALAARIPRRLRGAAIHHATMPLPTLTLSPTDLGAWSQTIANAHSGGCLGVLLFKGFRTSAPQRIAAGVAAVEGFRRLASRAARQLAILLSASEVHTYETMRIVQLELVPDSTAADLAQVLAGGLLYVEGSGQAMAFHFDHDVRRELHAELCDYDAYHVHRCLRTRLEHQVGPHSFRALIEDPDGTERIPPQLSTLAKASNSALRSAGYNVRTRRSVLRPRVAEPGVPISQSTTRGALSLLPPRPDALPELRGVQLGAVYQVAGDLSLFYLVRPMPDGGALFGLGDACGKGAEALAESRRVQHSLAALMITEQDPARLLYLLNRALLAAGRTVFTTLVLGALWPTDEGLRLTLAAGGHPPPMVLRRSGLVEEVAVPGTVVGLLPDARFGRTTITLRPGETVLLYSNGVTEARRRGAGGPEQFGPARLAALLRACEGMPAQAVATQVERTIADWLGRNDGDGLAALTLRAIERRG